MLGSAVTLFVMSNTSIPIDIAQLNQAAYEFVAIVDQCFGIYLDCEEGFSLNLERIVAAQRSSLPDVTKKVPRIETIEDMDNACEHFIGKGDPNDPNNVMYHRCKEGEYKRRNSAGDSNDKAIGRYCIVLLFEYWEREYRGRFARALGVPKPSLVHDLFGDLRFLRNAIIHHRGLATENCTRLKVLSPVPDDEEIHISGEDLFHLTRAIKAYVDNLVRTVTGRDPEYRTIWHVQ